MSQDFRKRKKNSEFPSCGFCVDPVFLSLGMLNFLSLGMTYYNICSVYLVAAASCCLSERPTNLLH